MPTEAGWFKEVPRPPGRSSRPSVTRVLLGLLRPRNLLTQTFKAAGQLHTWAWSPEELQRLVEEITSFPPARESPGDGAGRVLDKQEAPAWGGQGACRHQLASGVGRKQPWPLALDTGGPPPCPSWDVVTLCFPA